ncbi:MAG: hypothetical protein V4690_02180 [Patescibacteria group bacterium]
MKKITEIVPPSSKESHAKSELIKNRKAKLLESVTDILKKKAQAKK